MNKSAILVGAIVGVAANMMCWNLVSRGDPQPVPAVAPDCPDYPAIIRNLADAGQDVKAPAFDFSNMVAVADKAEETTPEPKRRKPAAPVPPVIPAEDTASVKLDATYFLGESDTVKVQADRTLSPAEFRSLLGILLDAPVTPVPHPPTPPAPIPVPNPPAPLPAPVRPTGLAGEIVDLLAQVQGVDKATFARLADAVAAVQAQVAAGTLKPTGGIAHTGEKAIAAAMAAAVAGVIGQGTPPAWAPFTTGLTGILSREFVAGRLSTSADFDRLLGAAVEGLRYTGAIR